jgi:hypothetical protein
MSLIPASRLRTTAFALASMLAAAVATAEPATITGTVIAADTGQPPSSGACLSAYDLGDSAPVASTCIDPQTGAYTLAGLQAGVDYVISVRSTLPYPTEMWLPGGPTRIDAQSVVAPATANANVPLAGTLTGTLSRFDGQPAAGISVSLFHGGWEYQCCGQTTTGSDGTWTIRGLYPTQ